MTLDRARRIADTVLLEGYVLYPYRASALKNRYRWTFGVLAPPSYAARNDGETSFFETQLLVEGRVARLRGCLRFLEVVDRKVERRGGGGWVEVDRLMEGGVEHVPWQEGRLHELPFALQVGDPEQAFWFDHDARVEIDSLGDTGRIVRTHRPLCGVVRGVAEPTPGTRRELHRLTLRVENTTPAPSGLQRQQAMEYALASTHVLLGVSHGQMLSAIDPPAYAQRAAAACRQQGLRPVVIGEVGSADQVLCSPIVLPDYPTLAPESPGDFFDACEIDELLVLRTEMLTDAEKAEARATDRRTAALLDRIEHMSDAERARLHGAKREQMPAALTVGARVRLHPSGRADAQDCLFEGMIATIHAVVQDVDGSARVAVTMDDDPAAELHEWYGRYRYYRPDEVEAMP
jgi:hypothetical protein